ncbi:MAG TPA: SAM-dependent chlorinase/fluorinase [Candidatus Limnocylindria bacterium]|nr:SAM-dependent chlorinase/fluorinase [Candidatus Limnocylindria bacterium]
MPSPASRPVIGFLTDFGLDGAAGTCRAVMLSICPDAQVVDIAHTIAKYAIRDGAFVLRAALPYFPVGVHVGVVDPGVGTSRRPIAIRAARGDLLVGPDNGLLVPAAEALGGLDAARELTDEHWWLPSTSATFHGRDIFAPVAAHLAAGDAAFEDLGPPIPVADLVRLPVAAPRVADGRLVAEVAYVDSYGNVRLAARRADLAAAVPALAPGGRLHLALPRAALDAAFAPSFGHVEAGEPLLYVDSNGDLALGINRASFAAEHGVVAGDEVRIGPT